MNNNTGQSSHGHTRRMRWAAVRRPRGEVCGQFGGPWKALEVAAGTAAQRDLKFWLQGHREDCCNKLSETGGAGLGGQCGEESETQGGHTHTTESDVLLG